MTDSKGAAPTDVKDSDVYHSLREYIINVHNSDLFDPLPIKRRTRFLDPDKSNHPKYTTIEPDFDNIRFPIPIREQTDGYDRAVSALKNCDFYDISERPENVVISGTFRSFFREIVNREPVIGEFDESTFDEVYRQFERLHTAEKVPGRVWTYLFGFSMDVDEIDVDERFTIRRMNQEEREFLHEKFTDPRTDWPMGKWDHWQRYVVEYRFEAPNSRMIEHRDKVAELDRLVTGLRVFQPDGSVNTGHVFVESLWDYEENPRGMNVIRSRRNPYGVSCRLSRYDADCFPDFFHKVEHLITTESDERFTSPLQRLNESHDKRNIEDRLLSCAIGFETLVLSEVSSSSYTFRLQLRPSILLKNVAFESLSEIRRFFKNIYWVRGEIVHGDRKMDDIMTDEQFVVESEDFEPQDFADEAQYFLGTLIRTYMLCDAVADVSVNDMNTCVEEAAFSAELDVDLDY